MNRLRNWAAALLILGIGCAGLLAAWHLRSPSANPTPAPDLASTCMQVPSAFVATSDLGDFHEIVSQHLTSFGVGSPEPQDAQIHGYVTSLAISGPFRAENDALVQSLHYKLGKWPLVPLVGSIVTQHPTLLEFYQTNITFKNVADAQRFMQAAKISDGGMDHPNAQTTPLALARRADDMYAFSGTLGPDDGQHEHVLGLDIRWGRRVVRLSLQGGAHQSAADTQHVASEAIAKAEAACQNRGA